SDRPAERQGRRPQGLAGAARSRVRLRDLRGVLPGIPPPPVHGAGHPGAPAGVDPQPPVPDPPGRGGAGPDPGRNLRPLEPRLARPLPPPRTPVTLLFAIAPTSNGSPGGGLTVLLMQIAAIGLVFYFLIIRPQSQARKQHE